MKLNVFEIVGVSPDGEKSHRGFADKHGLQFTLIADTDKSIASAYGVWGQKKFMGREYMGIPVSYTHLDVYKRQELRFASYILSPMAPCIPISSGMSPAGVEVPCVLM